MHIIIIRKRNYEKQILCIPRFGFVPPGMSTTILKKMETWRPINSYQNINIKKKIGKEEIKTKRSVDRVEK